MIDSLRYVLIFVFDHFWVVFYPPSELHHPRVEDKILEISVVDSFSGGYVTLAIYRFFFSRFVWGLVCCRWTAWKIRPCAWENRGVSRATRACSCRRMEEHSATKESRRRKTLSSSCSRRPSHPSRQDRQSPWVEAEKLTLPWGRRGGRRGRRGGEGSARAHFLLALVI